MLITVKNKHGDLKVKDILDIDFDMSVESDGKGFVVKINRQYWDTEKFLSRKDAEDQMLRLAEMRNTLEAELREW